MRAPWQIFSHHFFLYYINHSAWHSTALFLWLKTTIPDWTEAAKRLKKCKLIWQRSKVPHPKINEWSNSLSSSLLLPVPLRYVLGCLGTRALSSSVHSAEPAHVHSWDAIKSQQGDPWDMDEKQGGGGSVVKPLFQIYYTMLGKY